MPGPFVRAGAGNKLILSFYQSPGDTLVATGAVASLNIAYPGRYAIDVEGIAAREVFAYNPYITPGLDRAGAQVVRMENPLIHQSHYPIHFMSSYCRTLEQALGVPVPLKVNRPQLYLSEQEKAWIPRIEELTGTPRKRYWLVNAGSKLDYTVKQWPVEFYEEVVRHFRGRLLFVQVGAKEHRHPNLEACGAINEIGKSDLRQLIRLAYHADGILTGESLPWHLAAAWQKPAVCLASGFLPPSWVWYPTGRILSSHGQLPCCRASSCWKSRVVPLGDGDAKDRSLCLLPDKGFKEPVARCMSLIQPGEVIREINRFLDASE